MRGLGAVVAVEVLVIMVLNVVTPVRGGSQGFSVEPFTWSSFTSGSLAVGALFAIGIYTGYESTAALREEDRDPNRTIPRATLCRHRRPHALPCADHVLRHHRT